MEVKIVNFFQPGRILSLRFVDGLCVAKVDFGAPVAVILEPYQDEQVGDYIVMDSEKTFTKVLMVGATQRLVKRKEFQRMS